ncbi:MAG: autotransporter-associated beta strand repeat-containing protein [Thermoguttaceae bacterium]
MNSVGSVQFLSTGYTVSGAALNLVGDSGVGIAVNPGCMANWNINTTLNPGVLNFNAATGSTLNVGGTVALGGAYLYLNGPGNINLTNAVSGAGALYVSGGATATLSASNNSYTGLTSVTTGGTLNAISLGTGKLSVSNGSVLNLTGVSGLLGTYYDVTPLTTSFNTLQALAVHLSTQTSTLTANTTLPNTGNSNGQYFDFSEDGNGHGYFPGKYNPSYPNYSGNNFEAVYTGNIKITAGGSYSFGLNSDDGSMIWIDGQTVVTDNYWQGMDGSQPATQQTGSINLGPGLHKIVVGYFEGGGGYGLRVSYSGPDTSGTRVIMPNNVLSADTAVTSLTGGGTVNLNGTGLIVGGDGTKTTFSGLLAGAGGLTVVGPGGLTLSGANNTYALGTILVGGTLSVAAIDDGGASPLGPGSVYLNGGTFNFTGGNESTARFVPLVGGTIRVNNPATNLTLTNGLAGAVAFTVNKDGPGTLTLGGGDDNSFLQLNVLAGTAVLAKTTNTNHAVMNVAGVSNGATLRLSPVGGDQIFDQDVGVQNMNGTFDLNGASEGIPALTGTGNVTNTAASSTSTLTIGTANGGTFGSSAFGGNLANGAGGGVLALLKTGNATFTLSGSNTYSGGTTVGSGTLIATNTAALSNWATAGKVVVNAGSTLAVNGGGNGEWLSTNIDTLLTTVSFPTLSNFGIQVTNGNTFTYATPITGPQGFIKLGGGLLTFGGPNNVNSYQGDTTVSAGTLALGASAALPTTGNVNVNAGAVLDLAGFSPSVAGLGAPAGVITNSQAAPALPSILTVGANNANSTTGAVLAGNLALVKAGNGTLTLNAISTYSGGTTINSGGVLVAGTTLSLGNLGSGPLTLAGGTLRVNQATIGLLAQIYTPDTNVNNKDPYFVDLPTLTSHLAGKTPTVSAQTTANGAGLDFSNNGYGNNTAFTSLGNTTQADYEVRMSGVINLPTAGAWQFRTTSDDGSMLWVDGTEMVNNNYYQGANTRSDGTFQLSAGPHAITVGFYQGTGGAGLLVEYEAPGGSWTTIPNSVLGDGMLNNAMTLTADSTIDVTPAASGSITGPLYLSSLSIGDNTLHVTTGTNAILAFGGSTSLTGNVAAVFDVQNANLVTLAGPISATSTAGILKTNSGLLALTNTANAYVGGTTVGGGTLIASNPGALPSWATPGQVIVNPTGTLAVNGGGSGEWLSTNIDTLLTTVTFPSGSNFGIQVTTGNTFNYAGPTGSITGPQGFTKLGGGALTLTGANNAYLGATNVAGGTLALGTAGALPAASNVIVGPGGALDLMGNSPTVSGLNSAAGDSTAIVENNSASNTSTLTIANAGPSTFGGTIRNGGAASLGLTIAGPGMQTLTGVNTFSGPTAVSGGTLQAAVSALPTAVTLSNNSSLIVNQVSTGTLGVGVSGNGSFTKSGSGVLTLTAANSYSGPTYLTNGTLRVSTLIAGLNQAFYAYNNYDQTTGWNLKGVTLAPYAGEYSRSNNTGAATVWDPGTPNAGSWDRNLLNNTDATWTYTGSMYIASTSVSFEGVCDDNLRVKLDGAWLNNGNWNFSSGIVPVTPGWHTVQLSFFSTNGGGAGGYTNGNGFIGQNPDQAPYTMGNNFVVNEPGINGQYPNANSFVPIDPGDGSLFVAGYAGAGDASGIPTNSPLVMSSNTTFDMANTPVSLGSLADAAGGASGHSISLGSSGALTIGNDGTSTAFSGAINGGGTLIKVGAGMQTLTGSNNYSGGSTLAGGGFVVGGASALGTGPLNITAPIGTIQAAAGGASLSNAINIGTLLAVPGANNLTLSNTISGPSGALLKSGAGILTLGGNNSYGGGTSIQGGKIAVAFGTSLGGGGLTLSGGTLTLPSTSPLKNQDIGAVGGSGPGSTVQGPPGTYTVTGGGNDIWGDPTQFQFAYATLTGNFTVTADVNFNQTGTNEWSKAGITVRPTNLNDSGNSWVLMALSNQHGPQAQWNNGGGLGNNQDNSVSNTIRTAELEIQRAGDTYTMSDAPIVNGVVGSWAQVGQQTMSLGASVYVGLAVTAHDSGQLATAQFSNIQGITPALGFANNVTVTADSAIEVGDKGGPSSFPSLMIGDNTLQVVGGATAPGTITVNNATTLTGVAAATFDLQNGNALTLAGAVGPLTTNAAGITQTGAGTLTLAAANTYTGPTTLSGGTLNLSHQYAAQYSTLTMNGGSLVFGSASGTAFTLGGLAAASAGPGYDIALVNNATTPAAVALTVGGNGASTVYAGVLSDTPAGGSSLGGSLTKVGNGALVLTANNSYSGATNISGGTLQVGAGSNSGTVGTGPIANNATLVYNRSDVYPITNAVSGSGATVIQSGTVTGNSVTFASGPITLAGGRLQLTPATPSNVGIKFATGQNNATNSVTGTAGVVPMANWNNLTGYNGSAPPPTLVNSLGNPTGMSITYSGFGDNWSVFGGDQADQDMQLMNAYLDISNGARTGVISLSGIPYASYSVYAYFGSDGNNRNASATVNGTGTTYYYSTYVNNGGFVGYVPITNTDSGSNPNGNYALFSNLSGASQTLTVVDGGNNSGIMGVEVVANAAQANLANNVVVTADSGIDVTGATSAAIGPLSIGGNKLSVTGGATGADTAYTLTAGSVAISGNATFDVANNGAGVGTLALGALSDGGTARTITKSNSGMLVLGADAESLVDGTQVNVTGGTLAANSPAALGSLAAVSVAAPATLSFGANHTLGALSGAGSVLLGGNTLTVGNPTNNLSSTFSGVIADGATAGGSLVKDGAGTLRLTGIHTYTGPTSIVAGRLELGPTAGLGDTAISIGAGATFAPQPANGATITAGAGASNATLSLNDGGVFDMSGDNAAGTFQVNGPSGNVALLLAGGTLAFDVGATADQLLVNSGAAVASGAMTISITGLNGIKAGTYPLIVDAAGGLSQYGGTYSLLSPTVTVGGKPYGLTLSGNDTEEDVTVAAANNSLLTLSTAALTLNKHKGDTSTANVSVSNTGTDDGHFTATATGSTLNFSPTVSTLVAANNGSQQVSLAWDTSTAGARSATLSINNDDGGSLGVSSLALTGYVYSGLATWGGGSGAWSPIANWSEASYGGVPGVDGPTLSATDTATFNTAGAQTVSLDISPQVSALSLSNGPYTLNTTGAYTLHLSNTATGRASITSSGTQTISAPVSLDSPTTVTTPTRNSDILTLAGLVGGNSGLTKNGNGMLVLSSTNNHASGFTGGTTLSGGTLEYTSSAAVDKGNVEFAGGNLVLSFGAGGGSVVTGADSGSGLSASSPSAGVDSAAVASPSGAGAALTVAGVPEPGTLGLLAAGLLAGLIAWLRRRRA